MLDTKNTDDVFLRNLIVAITEFFYDSVFINSIEDGKIVRKPVKIFYSLTGEQQYLEDFFRKTDKYCDELQPVEGNINYLPSGRFKMVDANISTDELEGDHVRFQYNKTIETELATEIRTMSARGRFIPIEIKFDLSIKSSSELDRLKIWQVVLRRFYKVKKTWMSFEGFPKIPILIGFPEGYTMDKLFKFKYPTDTSRPMLDFSINVITYMPDMDGNTEVAAGNTIQSPKLRTDVETN